MLQDDHRLLVRRIGIVYIYLTTTPELLNSCSLTLSRLTIIERRRRFTSRRKLMPCVTSATYAPALERKFKMILRLFSFVDCFESDQSIMSVLDPHQEHNHALGVTDYPLDKPNLRDKHLKVCNENERVTGLEHFLLKPLQSCLRLRHVNATPSKTRCSYIETTFRSVAAVFPPQRKHKEMLNAHAWSPPMLGTAFQGQFIV